MSNELNQLIRDVAETMPDDATPLDIAQQVIEKAGEEIIGETLLGLIADRVQNVLGSHRGRTLNGANRSPRLERRRNWWSKVLQSRVHIGGGAWKVLGECTIDDLRFCVGERKEQISRTQVQINNYLHLIERMEKHKAATVADLKPEQVDL